MEDVSKASVKSSGWSQLMVKPGRSGEILAVFRFKLGTKKTRGKVEIALLLKDVINLILCSPSAGAVTEMQIKCFRQCPCKLFSSLGEGGRNVGKSRSDARGPGSEVGVSSVHVLAETAQATTCLTHTSFPRL